LSLLCGSKVDEAWSWTRTFICAEVKALNYTCSP
jgi:hypothetical protein